MNDRDSNNKIVATYFFNLYKNGIWYLIQDIYSPELSQKDKKTILQKATTILLQKEKVDLIRTWDFTHNEYNNEQIATKKEAGYIHLEKGFEFVWLPLSPKTSLQPENFHLSRLATQGII